MSNQNEPLLAPQQVEQFLTQAHFPPMQIYPGSIPPIQIPVQFPPALQPFVSNIYYHAINASQAEFQRSPLRTLHFNMMAQNGWSNPFFAFFMDNLIAAIDTALFVNAAGSRIPPDPLIATIADQYVQYRVAKNAYIYRLADRFPGPIQAALKDTYDGWMTVISRLQQDAARLQQMQQSAQPSGYYPGAQPGYSTPPGYTPPGYNPGYGQPQQGGFMNQPATGRDNIYQPQAINPNSQRFSAPPAPAYRAPAPQPVTSSVGSTNWRTPVESVNNSSSGPITASTQPERIFRQPNGPVATPPQPPSSLTPSQPPSAAPAVRNDSDDLGAKVAAYMKLAEIEAPPKVIASGAQAYDLNLFEKEQVLGPDGHTTARLRSLTPMDRDQHLRRPGYTPPWIKTPTIESYTNRLEEAKNVEPAGPVFEIKQIKEGNSQPCLDRGELWTKLSLGIQALEREQAKIRVLAGLAAELKPLKTSPEFPGAIDRIKECPDLETASIALRHQIANAGEDTLAFEEADKRLTVTINDILNNELQLTTRIDSFRDDMVDLNALLLKNYGQSVVEVFAQRAFSILNRSLLMITDSEEEGAKKFYQSVVNAYFEDVLEEKDRESLFACFFEQPLMLVSVDMSSVELSLHIDQDEAKKTASLLQQSSAPLAYELVDKIMALPGIEKVNKVLLKTTDDVVIQINRGAFNRDAYLVSLPG